jgi:hypothetical protein
LDEHWALIPSGYRGKHGDLLLARLAPPPSADAPHAVVLTTPYVIAKPGTNEWTTYFERTLPAMNASDRTDAYRALMRRGHGLLADRYWLEYVFEAYAGHSESAIVLHGLPDIAESRPHAMR